jgi:hypothetical protein
MATLKALQYSNVHTVYFWNNNTPARHWKKVGILRDTTQHDQEGQYILVQTVSHLPTSPTHDAWMSFPVHRGQIAGKYGCTEH